MGIVDVKCVEGDVYRNLKNGRAMSEKANWLDVALDLFLLLHSKRRTVRMHATMVVRMGARLLKRGSDSVHMIVQCDY